MCSTSPAALIDPAKGKAFQADFAPMRQKIARLGMINSLSQTLLRLASPGVPDTYQGTRAVGL